VKQLLLPIFVFCSCTHIKSGIVITKSFIDSHTDSTRFYNAAMERYEMKYTVYPSIWTIQFRNKSGELETMEVTESEYDEIELGCTITAN
jgi:hypothetical protein